MDITPMIGSRGHHVGVEDRGSHNLLFPRLYGHPALADLRDCLHRNQEVLLSHTQETPETYLQEAHLALLPVDVEIVHVAYLFPVYVIDIFAADVVLGV